MAPTVYAYNKDWELKDWAKGWLRKNDGPDAHTQDKQAYCNVCQKSYRAHITDLQKHANSATHVRNMNRLDEKLQPKINFTQPEKYETQKKDLKMSAFVACHTSINTSDHLSELLTNLKFKLDLRRTKCTGIIKNLIAPAMLQELVQDAKNTFSILVDESTDCAKFKYLAICIKYFCQEKAEVMMDFLTIIKIDKADADTLYHHLKSFFEKHGIDLSRIDALGTDGGTNLCGLRKSLYTLLKKHNPNLLLIKCVCHALNLAASHAAEEFPRHVETMLEQTYNWFSRSPLRQARYEQLWDLMNAVDEINGESGKDFHRIVKLSGTRWLARYNAVRVLRDQYFELSKYFREVVNNGERNYIVSLLAEMFEDKKNYLYLTIVEPILLEVNATNLLFQKQSVNVNVAYDELKSLVLLITNKILKTNSNDLNAIRALSLEDDDLYKSTVNIDFGVEYEYKKREIGISSQDSLDVEIYAFRYFKKLLRELVDRLPENLAHFDRLKQISTDICLSRILRCDFQNLPFIDMFIKRSDLGKVQNQYDKLINVDWKVYLTSEELNDSYKFWSKVWSFKNAGGQLAFRELSDYVLRILCLPTSNAVVERVFSIMNAVKSKIRNRMSVELLEAILRIRIHLFAHKKCCHSFEPSEEMLQNFTSKVIYPFRYADGNHQKSNEEQEKSLSEILIIINEVDPPCIHIT